MTTTATKHTPGPRYYWKPCYADPDNSASVFDRARKNHLGEAWCIDAGITYEQARRKVRALLYGDNPTAFVFTDRAGKLDSWDS